MKKNTFSFFTALLVFAACSQSLAKTFCGRVFTEEGINGHQVYTLYRLQVEAVSGKPVTIYNIVPAGRSDYEIGISMGKIRWLENKMRACLDAERVGSDLYTKEVWRLR